jgi:aspartate/methionine/tyrosine aminotransferase
MKPFLSSRLQGIEKTLIRQIHDRADASCLNLGLGELAFPTPEPILRQLREELREWNIGYTPNAGFPELRQLVAETSGLDVTADHVCATIGAEEALLAGLMVLVNPRDEVLIPDPGYPAYASIVKMAGGIPVPYPLRFESHFSLEAAEVEKRVTPQTRILLLNSPHNPTGAIYSGTELKSLAELCRRHDLTVVADEVYRQIHYDHPPDSIARYIDRCLVVNSLSKTYSMTGWRLGWCIGPPELIRLVITFNQLAVTCPPAVCQRAAILALKGTADGQKRQYLEELRRRRDLTLDSLEKHTDLKYFRPLGAFYVFADVSSKMTRLGNSLDICLNILAEEKVVVIPGIAFGQGGEGFLRLSFAARPEHIQEGIQRIGRFFSRSR